ncbi:MAG: PQQ-binding-like beta-propeller repeat protein [Pirellulaceae bacterium]
MPSRFALISSLVVVLLFGSVTAAWAQPRAIGIAASQLDNLGLKQEWSTQLPINAAYSRISHFTQVIGHENPLVVFDVKHNGESRRFSSADLNTFGRPLGEEEAKAQAEQYLARIDKSQKPELTRNEVPTITYYVMTDNGIIHALDGRTGRLLWTQSHGNRKLVSQKPAGNDEMVAYTLGTTLYVLNRANGEIKWQRKLEGPPAAGPTFSESKIFVPLTTGQVFIYDFDGGPSLAQNYFSIGKITTPVSATSTTVNWATDRGYIYVGDSHRNRVRYRLEANGKIVAPAANFQHLYLYFTTTDGYIYCLFAPDGAVQWRYSTGEEITTSPIAVRDSVFVTLSHGGLYKLSLTHGELRWFAPRVRQFLSASDRYVYALDDLNRLLVLDSQSGAVVGATSLRGFDFFETNHATDRIILGTKTGRLQVLRASGLEYPQIHVKMVRPATPEEEADMEKPAPERPRPAAEDPFGAPAADPFADPFAAPAAGETPADDPFGGPPAGANPFGGPAEDANPFGAPPADDNPFGGGGDDDNPFGS